MEVITAPSESEWSKFLAQTPDGNIFQSPFMHRVYVKTKHHEPTVLAAEEGGEIRAMLASVLIGFGPPGASLALKRVVVIGGPIGDPAAFPLLISAHDDIARRKAILSQLRNLYSPTYRSPFLQAGYAWQDHLNFTVDLRPGEEAVLGRMSEERREGIAHGDRSGLRLRVIDEADLPDVYGLLRETYSRAGVQLPDRGLFAAALEEFPAAHLWAFAALRGGEPCATRFVLTWGRTLFDWYAGTSVDGRNDHVDEWLLWQVLRKGIEQGYSTYDLGGAGRPGERYGLGEFKRPIGGKEFNPGRFEKVYRPRAEKFTHAVTRAWRLLG
jgi:serine/alanine adding enzyme